MLNAKNENIIINGHDFDYISFGSGRDVLIMLPGVGAGFKTAKGVALPFALTMAVFTPSQPGSMVMVSMTCLLPPEKAATTL